MQVQIETNEDALAMAKALAGWIEKGLQMSGFINKQSDEDQFYTGRRVLLFDLQEFIKRSR